VRASWTGSRVFWVSGSVLTDPEFKKLYLQTLSKTTLFDKLTIRQRIGILRDASRPKDLSSSAKRYESCLPRTILRGGSTVTEGSLRAPSDGPLCVLASDKGPPTRFSCSSSHKSRITSHFP